MAAYQDLQLDQGADFSQSMLITNSDGTATNVANYTFGGNIKYSYYAQNVAASLTITKTDPANGNITISLAAANTANLPAGHYVYDVSANSGIAVSRLVQGVFFVVPGITGITPALGLPYVP